MEKEYCIYAHKNKINGKMYIGQTCQKPEYRWGEGGERYINSTVFYRAIQKYGWDNFEHIILEDGLTAEEANQKEQEYIQKYNTLDRDFGYNLQEGGDNHKTSQETSEKISARLKQEWADGTRDKQKMSQVMKEKWKDPEFRAKQAEGEKKNPPHLSEEGRKRLSESRKAYIAEHGTPTQGRGHTEETKEKIRQSKLGDKNPMYGTHHTEEWKNQVREKVSQKVQCIETGDIFNSYKEAAQWCGRKGGSGLSDYFAGRKKSFGKHPITKEPLHWRKIPKNENSTEN